MQPLLYKMPNAFLRSLIPCVYIQILDQFRGNVVW